MCIRDRLKLKESIEKQVFPVEYQELLLNLDTESQNHVIAQLYKKIVRFNDFNGGDYFKTLDAIEDVYKRQLYSQTACGG